MPPIVLNTKIENREAIVGMGRRWPAVIRTSLKAVARYWLEKKFPGHFTPGNEARYHHDERNKFYKRFIKPVEGEGQGKFVDLLLKGKSKRWLWTSATISGTQHHAIVRMKGPAYFANPFIGRLEKQITQTNYNARQNMMEPGMTRTIIINITRQPDKVRELTEVSIADKNDLQQFLQNDIGMRARIALVGRGVVAI
jgi:hypothetical protein